MSPAIMIRRIVFLGCLLPMNLCGEVLVEESELVGLDVDPALASLEKGRVELYRTMSLMNFLIEKLNEYYQLKRSYPKIKEWVNYISNQPSGININSKGGFICDAYGDPISYIPISEDEVWLYSINLYEEFDKGQEKVSIFKLISGKLHQGDDFEP